jgi:hypothetical protein
MFCNAHGNTNGMLKEKLVEEEVQLPCILQQIQIGVSQITW